MTKSIYTKLVAIIIVLILALMAVVGAFLMRGVRNFYINDFYTQMQEAFSGAVMAGDLRAAADEPEAAVRMAGILRANSGQLGINTGTRNYFILDGATGAYITDYDARWAAMYEAEALVMQEAVVAPLYTKANANLISADVSGIEFHPVALNRVYKNASIG